MNIDDRLQFAATLALLLISSAVLWMLSEIERRPVAVIQVHDLQAYEIARLHDEARRITREAAEGTDTP